MQRTIRTLVTIAIACSLGCADSPNASPTDVDAAGDGAAGGAAVALQDEGLPHRQWDPADVAGVWAQAWNSPDEATRLGLLSHIASVDMRYDSPDGSAEGLVAVSDLIAGAHRAIDGLHVVPVPYGLQIARTTAHATWEVMDATGQVLVTGVDLMEFSEDGLLQRVTSHRDGAEEVELHGAYSELERALGIEGPTAATMEDNFAEGIHMSEGPYIQLGRPGMLDYLVARPADFGTDAARIARVRSFGDAAEHSRMKISLLDADGSVQVELTAYTRLDDNGRFERIAAFASDPAR